MCDVYVATAVVASSHDDESWHAIGTEATVGNISETECKAKILLHSRAHIRRAQTQLSNRARCHARQTRIRITTSLLECV